MSRDPSGRIVRRKLDGFSSMSEKDKKEILDLLASASKGIKKPPSWYEVGNMLDPLEGTGWSISSTPGTGSDTYSITHDPGFTFDLETVSVPFVQVEEPFNTPLDPEIEENMPKLGKWVESHVHNSEPIFDWDFESSKARAGGRKTIYTTVMFPDGCLSCNCPGWTFKKANEERHCKHTAQVYEESRELLKRHKAGENITANRQTTRVVQGGGKSENPDVGFDRNVEFD